MLRNLISWWKKRGADRLASRFRSDPRMIATQMQRDIAAAQMEKASKFAEGTKKYQREVDALRAYLQGLR